MEKGTEGNNMVVMYMHKAESNCKLVWKRNKGHHVMLVHHYVYQPPCMYSVPILSSSLLTVLLLPLKILILSYISKYITCLLHAW